MPINYRKRKKERLQKQVDRQEHERALNRFICEELKSVGTGSIEMVRQRILKDVASGKIKIPKKYF